MNWLTWLFPSKAVMSREWLEQANRPSSRVEFQGVCWSFPVKKLLIESPLWNRHVASREQKRAS